MPHSDDLITSAKPSKVKKTLDDLLGEGQVKTGKAVLDEREQKERELEIFAQAAQEEERNRRHKRTR